MASEPLIPLARAIAAEAARLEIPVIVKVDRRRAAVVIEGEALKNWGCRTRLEATLSRHRVRHDTHMPAAYIVAYPVTSGPARHG
ncbi:hypothetical protein ABH926_008941 [Catenulispora sp. GP43]|uniref:hypothetical protein n=1 Tax=Catenulispora sp. GP43 TaxID=3156263 RepID=UPI0035144F83